MYGSKTYIFFMRSMKAATIEDAEAEENDWTVPISCLVFMNSTHQHAKWNWKSNG